MFPVLWMNEPILVVMMCFVGGKQFQDEMSCLSEMHVGDADCAKKMKMESQY